MSDDGCIYVDDMPADNDDDRFLLAIAVAQLEAERHPIIRTDKDRHA